MHMISRLAILCGLLVAMAGVVMSQQTASRKRDHVVRVEPLPIPNFGDNVFAADNEIASRIPPGIVTKLIKHTNGERQKVAESLSKRPGIAILGWTNIIHKIDDSSMTVLSTPQIQDGGITATTACGAIREVYRFENGELVLVSAKVEGHPTAYIRD